MSADNSLAVDKLNDAAQTLRHLGALLYTIEFAAAAGRDQTKIDTLSLAEIGTRIAGEAAESIAEWADVIGKREVAE